MTNRQNEAKTKRSWLAGLLAILGVVLGGGGLVAYWNQITEGFRDRKSYEVMVCAGANCQEESVKNSRARGEPVADLSRGTRSAVIPVPGIGTAARIVSYTCIVLDNKEQMPSFGKLYIHERFPGGFIITSASRGSAHIPIQVDVIFSSFPFEEQRTPERIECTV